MQTLFEMCYLRPFKSFKPRTGRFAQPQNSFQCNFQDFFSLNRCNGKEYNASLPSTVGRIGGTMKVDNKTENLKRPRKKQNKFGCI